MRLAAEGTQHVDRRAIGAALLFYIAALHIERQKPCDEQHTNQLTAHCKKELGAIDR
jgi:hypothetical protein